jgi:carbonic anhydrase
MERRAEGLATMQSPVIEAALSGGSAPSAFVLPTLTRPHRTRKNSVAFYRQPPTPPEAIELGASGSARARSVLPGSLQRHAPPGRSTTTAVAVLLTGASLHAGAAVDSCTSGRRQSPIDIVSTTQAALPALDFDYRRAPLRVVNDGHTVRVRFANGSRLLIGGQVHALQQFHFHLPGGDRIRGEDFPMAMHFLHKSPAGRLVALVVPFRLGAENAALATLLPGLPLRGQPERTVPGVSVDPASFIPGARGYYAYEGSETAPPCTEGVRWLVMKQALALSAAQLAVLQRLFPGNARPVQPLNGRVVQESP